MARCKDNLFVALQVRRWNVTAVLYHCAVNEESIFLNKEDFVIS